MKLSVIIPVLNDNAELNATIASIHATVVHSEVEVIVVDDRSDVPAKLSRNFAPLKITLHRNEQRIGAGGSRHIGAGRASGDYLLLLDSHMRFEPGWFHKAIERISGRDNTVHCGSCLGLDSSDMEVEEFSREIPFGSVRPGRRVCHNGISGRKLTNDYFETRTGNSVERKTLKPAEPVTVPATPRYFGAMLNLLGPNPANPSEHQVFEGVWMQDRQGMDDYEISCLMGACYFFSRDWFFHIGGLAANKHWGSEEPYLSLKTYLAGGSVRLMKGVRVGHRFNTGTLSYPLFVYWKNYNKIRSIMTTCGHEEAAHMISFLENEPDIALTWKQLEKDRDEIEKETNYNRSIFQHDLTWFCKKFGLIQPLNIGPTQVVALRKQ